MKELAASKERLHEMMQPLGSLSSQMDSTKNFGFQKSTIIPLKIKGDNKLGGKLYPLYLLTRLQV